MPTDTPVSRDRFLAFARKLALLTTCTGVPLAACGGASSGAPPPEGPTTGATSVSSGTTTSPMPTDGPCRCSWDSNASAAPRVCKKGEENYEGVRCTPGHPSGESGMGPYPYPSVVPGPLPPPDLPA